MARRSNHLMLVLLGFAWCSASSALAQYAAPTIVLDYTYDTNNFFGAAGSPQRIALQQAATTLTSRLSDTLTSIASDQDNSWSARFNHPGLGTTQSVPNLVIAQNEIRVFAGGRELGGTTLGEGGPGGFSASGFQPFFDNLRSRGQAGALGAANAQTDFGPWGGAITFDSVGTSWNFSLAGPVAGQSDFLSVAQHELGHLLGLGIANSWDNKIVGGLFTGVNSTASNGGVNPSLNGALDHWASGTMSTNLQGVAQEAAMTPSITIGTRKEFTTLDYAGLADIGWQVSPVPEPASLLALASIGLLVLRRVSGAASASRVPNDVIF